MIKTTSFNKIRKYLMPSSSGHIIVLYTWSSSESTKIYPTCDYAKHPIDRWSASCADYPLFYASIQREATTQVIMSWWPPLRNTSIEATGRITPQSIEEGGGRDAGKLRYKVSTHSTMLGLPEPMCNIFTILTFPPAELWEEPHWLS